MSSTDQALTIPPVAGELMMARRPEQVLAEAKKAADALQAVIKGKKNPVKFGGEQYIESDDWQLVAHFYGVTAKVENTSYVDFGGVKGFEATAVALDRDGREISRAESMCLSDEENWGAVPVYEYKDVIGPDGKKIWDKNGGKNHSGAYVRERVQVGTQAKPLFQLRSMAQTRACAKVLRNLFAWVIVMAGYKPTVAEEMTGNESNDHANEETQQQEALPKEIKKKSETKPEPKAEQKAAPKSEPQTENHGPLIGEKGPGRGKRLYAICKSASYEVDDIRRWIGEQYGIPVREGHTLPNFDDIPVKIYDTICQLVEKKAVKFAPPEDASPSAGEVGFDQSAPDDDEFYSKP
jgi:hypothetical protein